MARSGPPGAGGRRHRGRAGGGTRSIAGHRKGWFLLAFQGSWRPDAAAPRLLVHEVTEVITENTELLALEPKARLVRTAEMILEYDLTAHEFGVRQWGLQDATAARAVRRVNRTRLDFIRSAFAELGFGGDDLEMRTMLFAVYQSFEGPMLREISRKRRRELIERRVELLASR